VEKEEASGKNGAKAMPYGLSPPPTRNSSTARIRNLLGAVSMMVIPPRIDPPIPVTGFIGD